MTSNRGKEKELLAALLHLKKLTHEEEECIAYEIWRSKEDPLSFIVYERFNNLDAIKNT